MSLESTSAGQPGALSCSEGQQATDGRPRAAALIFELIGVLLFDVAGAEAAASYLEDQSGHVENAQSVRECAAVSRQLAAFLADLARDGLVQASDGLGLDGCAGYLISPQHQLALKALVNAQEVRQ